MTEADIQVIVQEVMRRMFGGNSSSPERSNTSSPSTASGEEPITISSVVTRSDIADFVKAGKNRLVVQHGGLITPLARDLAAEQGIEVVWATDGASPHGAKSNPGTPVAGPQLGHAAKAQHVLTLQPGQTALTCLRCSSCLEPAFYERALSEMEHSTARVLGELRAFIARCWLHEPADIATLRSISRPPMGNLPCCFYANFNLFWAGENLQVCRQLVKDSGQPTQVVCQVVAGLLERHAARLEKWSMTETVALERMLAQYFKGKGPATTEEFLAVVEHTLIALDRVQSWIDGLLPWSELDARLALRRPISVI